MSIRAHNKQKIPLGDPERVNSWKKVPPTTISSLRTEVLHNS